MPPCLLVLPSRFVTIQLLENHAFVTTVCSRYDIVKSERSTIKEERISPKCYSEAERKEEAKKRLDFPKVEVDALSRKCSVTKGSNRSNKQISKDNTAKEGEMGDARGGKGKHQGSGQYYNLEKEGKTGTPTDDP